jgi:hypothetical protein
LGNFTARGFRVAAALFVVTGPYAVPSLTRMPYTPRLKPAALAPLLILALAFAAGLRAQVTETTQTIEPGGVLLRMDALSLGIQPDTSAPNQYHALGLGTSILYAGLTDSIDMEIGTQLFLRDTFSQSGSDHTESGVGDVTLRPKWTFWRDPASGQAAAVVPYVMIPTDSKAVGNNSVQGGVIVPWSMDIAPGLKAAAMAEWDELRNVGNTRYDTRWYGSAYIKWDLGHTLGAYAEATLSDSTAGSSSFAGTMGAGATLSVSSHFEWDFEVSKVLGPGRNAWAEVLGFRWKIL